MKLALTVAAVALIGGGGSVVLTEMDAPDHAKQERSMRQDRFGAIVHRHYETAKQTPPEQRTHAQNQCIKHYEEMYSFVRQLPQDHLNDQALQRTEQEMAGRVNSLSF